MFKKVMDFCREGGFLLTLVIFLLFSNLITTVMVSSKTNKALHFQEEAIKLVIEMELKNRRIMTSLGIICIRDCQ